MRYRRLRRLVNDSAQKESTQELVDFLIKHGIEYDERGFAQKLVIMRRSSDLVRNRLRQQAGNLNKTTRSLARPVPHRARLIEFLGKADERYIWH